MNEAEVILEKARGKFQLARKLEHEAAGLAKQSKSLQKEADAHRSEAERLLLDNEQTELPLEPKAWKCQNCGETFTSNPGETHTVSVPTITGAPKTYSCGPVVAVEVGEEPEESEEETEPEEVEA